MHRILITIAVFLAASTTWPAQVSRVIDGDTFVLSDGQKVRLIDVNGVIILS